ncbi:MAG: terminase small subunit [Myxococcota bacterium]
MAIRGRRAFSSVQELEARIEDYFLSLRHKARPSRGETGRPDALPLQFDSEQMDKPPSMVGMASALGVTRMTINNYARRNEFLPVIARAKNRIAAWHEEALYSRSTYRAARFTLEVNHGYRRQEDTGKGQGRTCFEVNVLDQSVALNRPIMKWTGK